MSPIKSNYWRFFEQKPVKYDPTKSHHKNILKKGLNKGSHSYSFEMKGFDSQKLAFFEWAPKIKKETNTRDQPKKIT